MNEKKLFLKTKNEIDDKKHLKINSIENKNFRRMLKNNKIKDLSYVVEDKEIKNIFYNSLLNELDYILNGDESIFFESVYDTLLNQKSYIGVDYKSLKTIKSIESIIKGFYMSKLLSLQYLVNEHSSYSEKYENYKGIDFLLCSKDKFVIPLRNSSYSGNVLTSNIFTFVNPNYLDYHNEVFYPSYIQNEQGDVNNRYMVYHYEKYFNFRIMTKSIENKISLFPEIDWIARRKLNKKDINKHKDFEKYFYIGDNFNIQKEALYSAGACSSIEGKLIEIYNNMGRTKEYRRNYRLKFFTYDSFRYQFKYKTVDSFNTDYFSYLYEILLKFYNKFMTNQIELIRDMKLLNIEKEDDLYIPYFCGNNQIKTDFYRKLNERNFKYYTLNNSVRAYDNKFHKSSKLYPHIVNREYLLDDNYITKKTSIKLNYNKKSKDDKYIFCVKKLNDFYDYEIYKDFYEEIGYHNPYISEMERIISRDGSVIGTFL